VIELRSVYLGLYAAVSLVALAASWVAWRRRAARGAWEIAFLMVGVAIWSATAAAMWSATALEQQIFWLRASALGWWMIPVGVLALAFDIAKMDEWLTPRRVAPVAIALFVAANIRWINPWALYDTAFVEQAIGPYTHYVPIPGPLYWAFNAMAYSMVVAAIVILVRIFLRTTGSEREQAAILVVGGLVPLAADMLTESRLIPLVGLDLGPVSLLVTSALWMHAIFRGTMLDVVPVAWGTLVEQMADGVVVFNEDDHAVLANPAALAILQRSSMDVLGRSMRDVLGDMEGVSTLLAGEGRRHAMLPLDFKNGSLRVEVGVTPLVVGPSRVDAQLVTVRDVTHEQQIVDRLELARTVFDTANEGMLITTMGTDQEVIDVNDAYCRMTQRPREDIVGKPNTPLQSDRHPPEFYDAVADSLNSTGRWEGENWVTRADGSEFPSWLSISVVKEGANGPDRVVAIVTDISAVKEVGDLRYGATHDALTGLANRFVLDDRLARALARMRRGDGGLAVLFVDVDHFKDVNDSLGHAQGDALLVEIAKRIAGDVRGNDTVGRPGGDEFIVVTDSKDPAQVDVEARRLRELLARPYHLGRDEVRITVSIGIALYPTDGTDATALIQHADLAMYGAKRLGRNRVQFYSDELQQGLNLRVSAEREVRQCLSQDRCFLLYQPQIDLSTGQTTGVEAFAHLRTEEGTVLSSAEFMHAIEYSELAVELAQWALHTAFAELATVHHAAPDLSLLVNLSPRQLRGIDATWVRDELAATGVNARCLSLEITETTLKADPEEVVGKLESLKEVAGIKVSLSDIGAGHLWSPYARTFRSGTIRIARSLVQLVADDREARAMAQSTIALAKGLGAIVAADGVETAAQLRFLQANGCDTAAGFFFGYPVSAKELALALQGEPVSFSELRGVAADA
jgi:diguanylate cyclase (GGDEF)-like protein/PAS domain S-box-containing protein